jgi:hypothetical protein
VTASITGSVDLEQRIDDAGSDLFPGDPPG